MSSQNKEESKSIQSMPLSIQEIPPKKNVNWALKALTRVSYHQFTTINGLFFTKIMQQEKHLIIFILKENYKVAWIHISSEDDLQEQGNQFFRFKKFDHDYWISLLIANFQSPFLVWDDVSQCIQVKLLMTEDFEPTHSNSSETTNEMIWRFPMDILTPEQHNSLLIEQMIVPLLQYTEKEKKLLHNHQKSLAMCVSKLTRVIRAYEDPQYEYEGVTEYPYDTSHSDIILALKPPGLEDEEPKEVIENEQPTIEVPSWNHEQDNERFLENHIRHERERKRMREKQNKPSKRKKRKLKQLF